jgi:hypothetical protein
VPLVVQALKDAGRRRKVYPAYEWSEDRLKMSYNRS